MVTDKARQVRVCTLAEAGLAQPPNGALAELAQVPEGPFVVQEKATAVAKALEAILQVPVQVSVKTDDGSTEYGRLPYSYAAAVDTPLCESITLRWGINPTGQLYDTRGELQKIIEVASYILPWAVHYEKDVQTDSLTGITNRRTLDALIANDLAELRRFETPNRPHAAYDAPTPAEKERRMDTYAASCSKGHALLMIDVDHFKNYNTSNGHPGGDEALKFVAHTLREVCRRETDIVARSARYGGEEFTILLQQCTAGEAANIAEKLRAAVEERSTVAKEEGTLPAALTVSIGVAHTYEIRRGNRYEPYDPNKPNRFAVVELADYRLNQAKEPDSDGRSRNRVVALGTPSGNLERYFGETNLPAQPERQLSLLD